MSQPYPTRSIFPAALLLEGRPCLVVGGGRVAFRKVSKLAEAGAAVRVVAPAMDGRLADLPGVVAIRRPFAPEDLDGIFLAFAATNDPVVNGQVLDLCRARRILCSAADAHWPEGDLILPASFTEDGLTVAISSSGMACRRSRRLRENFARHAGFLRDVGLLTIGSDHSGNDLSAIETLKAARTEIETLLDNLWGIHEYLVLDTCNRFEIVALAATASVAPLATCLRRIVGAEAPVHAVEGRAAFQRLAEVASGLRAQALGETRIVAQLKEALHAALRQGRAGSGLQGWTDLALHLSKAIRRAVAPCLAVHETEDLVARYLAAHGRADARLLIVGRGEIGQGLVRRFPSAEQLGGRAADALRARLPEVDVVVCATRGAGFVLNATHRPLLRPGALLIDLALPRNIDPALPGVVGLGALRTSISEDSAEAIRAIVQRIVAHHAAEYERLAMPMRGHADG